MTMAGTGELRQRTPRSPNGRTAKKPNGTGKASIRPSAEQVEQYYVLAVRMLQAVHPYYKIAHAWFQKVCVALEPYHVWDLGMAFYGLVLVFFGGVFMTLVSAIEAGQIFGWPKIARSLKALRRQWKEASVAFERDNQRDDDGDGVRDVDSLSTQELAARRFAVLLRAVDPDQVAAAAEGLTAAWVAILATLRVKFAKAITFGTAIGNLLTNVLGGSLTTALESVVPDDYDRWVPVLVRYGLRYIGVSVAWFLLRITTSAYSAMRGSQLFLVGLCGYLLKHGYMESKIGERHPVWLGSWGIIACFGWWWQISRGFSLPLPFNLLLLPFTIVEQALVIAVGVTE